MICNLVGFQANDLQPSGLSKLAACQGQINVGI